jgi:biopolymer transport protein ExbB
MLFLLQVAEDKISLLSLLQKGGWIMYPLYFLLVIAIFVFIERVLAIKKAGTMDPKFMFIIKDHILSGNIDAAKSMAKNADNPVAKMIEKGIMRIGKPIESVEKSMENVGKLEMYSMERN